MPIYEYVCGACGHNSEVLQGIRDQPLSHCAQCGQPALQKLVSAAGFRLKGSGWYETDFKAAGDKKKNLAENSNSAESSATSPASSTATVSTTTTDTAVTATTTTTPPSTSGSST